MQRAGASEIRWRSSLVPKCEDVKSSSEIKIKNQETVTPSPIPRQHAVSSVSSMTIKHEEIKFETNICT